MSEAANQDDYYNRKVAACLGLFREQDSPATSFRLRFLPCTWRLLYNPDLRELPYKGAFWGPQLQ